MNETSAETRPRHLAGSRVTICGSVTQDVVHRHGGATRQIGGTVWFAGTTLAGLGLHVRVLTRLAASDGNIAEALQARGIETHLLPSGWTTTFHNIYGPGGGDDRRQRLEAVAPPIPLEAVEAALDGAHLCYLGALHPGDVSAEALDFLTRCAVPMAFDVQGFTRRRDGAEVLAEVAPALGSLLPAARVIKASASEACLITGACDPAAAAQRLAAMAPAGELLVTCGRDGVMLAVAQSLHHLAAAPREDADPTGAGDIFLAAYMARRLAGEAPTAAAAFAVSHTACRLDAAERIVRLQG